MFEYKVGLLDLADKQAFPFGQFSETENITRKGYARDIILQRVDECYKNKLLDLRDLKDLMYQIKQLKDAETSCNPNSVITELTSLGYEPSRMSATEFNTQFDKLVQKRNNLELIPNLFDAEC